MENKTTPEKTLSPSSLETIDFAFYNWLNETLDLYTDSNDGMRKVPIIWITAERAFQVKNNKELREIDSQAIIYPAMIIERTSVAKTDVNERVIPGNLFPIRLFKDDAKRGAFPISRKIVKDKSRNFKNAESKRLFNQNNFKYPEGVTGVPPVYETLYIPYPVFLNVNYSIKIRTQYLQQLNQMVQPFQTYTGGINQFLVNYEHHTYEAFIEPDYGISSNSTNLGEDEKRFDSEIKIKVLGYVTTNDVNQNTPVVVKREGPVKIRFTRERVMLEDINEAIKNGFYRE
jgi:hypothetical protein